MIDTVYKRVVVDTNVFVSAILFRDSAPARAVTKVLNGSELLVSRPILDEVSEVLSRTKFDLRITLREREAVLANLALSFRRVEVVDRVTDCVDAKDNKFLELALSGRADLILTGDDHLLRLGPWRGVAILTPRAFLELAG